MKDKCCKADPGTTHKCPPKFTKTESGLWAKEKSTPKIDWQAKYLELLSDYLSESKKWADRVELLQALMVEKLSALQQENEEQLQEGYAQAWDFLSAERDKVEALETTVANLKSLLEPVANPVMQETRNRAFWENEINPE